MTSPVEPTGPIVGEDITSDDKLWGLLAWVLAPVVPIIILLMPEKKARPFLKAHVYQALAVGIVQVLLWAFSFLCVTAIVGILLFVAQIYWGWQAYQGKYVTIPVLTDAVNDFVKKQGIA
jgi:uncharacterized membrane protein